MFKEKFISLRTNRQLKKQDVKHLTSSYDRANKIGLLFTIGSAEKQENVRRFMKQLEADGKQVDVMAYRRNRKEEEDKFFFNYFTAADFSFWGSVQSEELKNFINNRFDFLFCLDEKPDIYAQHILSSSNASSRIGHYDEATIAFFEMQFKPKNGSGTTGLTNEILFYIKKLTHYDI